MTSPALPNDADLRKQRQVVFWRLLERETNLSSSPALLNLARVVLALGAQGQVVMIGRGAGLILTRPTTLHVRVVAPLPDWVAYMGQWLRLTVEEAADIRTESRRRYHPPAEASVAGYHVPRR